MNLDSRLMFNILLFSLCILQFALGYIVGQLTIYKKICCLNCLEAIKKDQEK